MKPKCGWFVSSVLALFLALPGYSKNLEPVFNELKTTIEDYQTKGTVCEQVARLELEQQFPASEYTVLNGITYSRQGQILGELDVVVFRNRDHHAVLIGEVKCWHDLHAARIKAMHQRERFQSYLEHGARGIEFYKNTDHRVHYSFQQFAEIPPFILISQDDGRNEGFDLTIPYSLDEMMDLRDMLIRCQATRDCLTPFK
jgi:hypothetical protein